MKRVTFSLAQRKALWASKCSIARHCFMKRSAVEVQHTNYLAPYGMSLDKIVGYPLNDLKPGNIHPAYAFVYPELVAERQAELAQAVDR